MRLLEAEQEDTYTPYPYYTRVTPAFQHAAFLHIRVSSLRFRAVETAATDTRNPPARVRSSFIGGLPDGSLAAFFGRKGVGEGRLRAVVAAGSTARIFRNKNDFTLFTMRDRLD